MVAELEDVADLDRLADLSGAPQFGTAFAFTGVADVGGNGRGEVATGGDVAEVIVQLVGAGDQVGAAFESFVEHDR